MGTTAKEDQIKLCASLLDGGFYNDSLDNVEIPNMKCFLILCGASMLQTNLLLLDCSFFFP